MSDAFNSIEQGLKEALAFTKGEGPALIHEIDVPDTRNCYRGMSLSGERGSPNSGRFVQQSPGHGALPYSQTAPPPTSLGPLLG